MCKRADSCVDDDDPRMHDRASPFWRLLHERRRLLGASDLIEAAEHEDLSSSRWRSISDIADSRDASSCLLGADCLLESTDGSAVTVCVESPEPGPRYAVWVMGEKIVPIPGGKP